MENTRNKMALIVGAIIVILAGLWYWLTPVECLMKIKVTIGNDGVKSAVANNPTNIGFRMNGAARALNSQYHIIETARKYMRQKPDCSMEKAQKLFRCVQIEQDKADARIWNIKSVARTSEEARLIAEVYSESLIKYFRDEQVGLNRKMMSWFDQQIYHKRKRGECVAELEKVKHIALRQEEGRAVDIVKTDEVEIKRKCSILSSGWLLFFAGESRYEGNLDFIFSYSDENAQIENERTAQQVNSSVGKFLTEDKEKSRAHNSHSRTNLFHEIDLVGKDGGLSYEELFKSVAAATNLTLSAGERAIWKLAQKISKIQDPRESFYLHDRFLETIIAQEVTIAEYNRRQNWYAKLWHGAMTSFCEAQRKQGNDFAYWEKIFRFYAKYTNEIVSVENELSKVDRLKWNRSMVLKGGYLHGIKGELKTWVRVMRDFEFPKMSKNYTSDQKADILRRFKEVEKYTVTPPHYPGGRGK